MEAIRAGKGKLWAGTDKGCGGWSLTWMWVGKADGAVRLMDTDTRIVKHFRTIAVVYCTLCS